MAFQSAPPGFGGFRWGEQAWAKWNALGDPRFRVANSAALTPTVSTAAARSITVAAGDIECCGISATNSQETVAFAANGGTADRYDALVARVDWATKTVSLAVVQGGTAPPVINQGASAVAGQVNWIPGVQYDGVIAIVRVTPNVGTFGPTNLNADCRMWGSSGGLETNTIARLAYVDVPSGASIRASGTRYWKEGGSLVKVVRGSSGSITPAGGWAAYGSGQAAPGWHKSDEGVVTLRGLLRRTAGDFFAATTEQYNVVTSMPAEIAPPSGNVPQPTYVGMVGGRVPALMEIWSSGMAFRPFAGIEGTIKQNTGYVSLNGITWYV